MITPSRWKILKLHPLYKRTPHQYDRIGNWVVQTWKIYGRWHVVHFVYPL